MNILLTISRIIAIAAVRTSALIRVVLRGYCIVLALKASTADMVSVHSCCAVHTAIVSLISLKTAAVQEIASPTKASREEVEPARTRDEASTELEHVDEADGNVAKVC